MGELFSVCSVGPDAVDLEVTGLEPGEQYLVAARGPGRKIVPAARQLPHLTVGEGDDAQARLRTQHSVDQPLAAGREARETVVVLILDQGSLILSLPVHQQ